MMTFILMIASKYECQRLKPRLNNGFLVLGVLLRNCAYGTRTKRSR